MSELRTTGVREETLQICFEGQVGSGRGNDKIPQCWHLRIDDVLLRDVVLGQVGGEREPHRVCTVGVGNQSRDQAFVEP